MIRLGVRLTVNGGREALVRLVVTAAAVALGVGLLLVTVAGINAVQAQNRRIAWLSTSAHNLRPSVDEATSDPLWATAALDEYRGSTIQRIDVAGTGPRSPVPPGIPGLPQAGQFYASPALARLLRTTPAAELGDRYPGHQVGIVGPSALASPDSLVIMVGHSVAELSQTGAHEVRSIETAPQGTPGDPHPDRIEFILAVVAGALLLPVLIFIGAATRLAAARREQRFAAMRLIGATPRQVSIVAATEACVAAACGVAGGFALFFLLRSPLAGVPFTGRPFFPGDLSLDLSDILTIAIGVPIAAAVAARLALRRVQISPLGVTRRVTPSARRAWRVIPLLIGLAELGFFVGRRPDTTGSQILAYGTGFLLVMVGLVIAGPWITMLISRMLARNTGRPAVLIAGRRLSDNPRAAFRAVSGLIVALFIATATVGIITTIVAYHSASTGGAAGRDILYVELAGGQPFEPATPADAASTDTLASQLTSIRGVRAVTVVRADPRLVQGAGPGTGLVSCAQLARMPTLGRCAPGVAVASIPLGFGSGAGVAAHPSEAASTWPNAHIPADQLDRLPVQDLYVDAGGSPSVTRAGPNRHRAGRADGGHPQHGQRHQPRQRTAAGQLATARRRRDHRQPGHRRLQPGRERRGRTHRTEATVQPPSAHRHSTGCAAPRRRTRGGRPAHSDCDPVCGRRSAGRPALPEIAAQRNAPAARAALLPDRCRRPRRRPRDHRRDASVARAHHRSGGSPERVTLGRVQHPQRDSNPCYRLERAASWATGRWGLTRGRGHSRYQRPSRRPPGRPGARPTAHRPAL